MSQRLLAVGNAKLGAEVFSWSLPAGGTCPGRTPLCVAHCYASAGRFLRSRVQATYDRHLDAVLGPAFLDRMVREIDERQVRLLRVHVSGDFHSPSYVRTWEEIARLCLGTRMWAYTRSWRVPAIRKELERLALRPNFRLWFSCDQDSGLPAVVPPGVRLAWMQTTADQQVHGADLVFRVAELRRTVAKRVGGALVCPVENGATGHRTDCARCGVCWR